MKFTKFPMALLIATLIIASCNTVKDALDVTFDTSFTAPLNIDVPEGTKAGINGTFNESATIDPLTDENVKKYADNLKDFEVTELTGEITSINKDVTLTTMTITVSNASKSTSWTVNNVAISQGTKITFGNDNGEWDTVNNILKDKQEFTVTAQGETDQDGVQFNLNLTIKVRVTANPL